VVARRRAVGSCAVELFIFITIFVLLAFYVAYGLRFLYSRKWLRVLLGPGILAANASRLLACQATFTPRVATNVWERDGVRWEKTALPWFAPTFIATCTFALPFGLLFALNHLLGYPLLFEQDNLGVPDLHAAFDGFPQFVQFVLSLDDHAFDAFKQIAGAVSAGGVRNPVPLVMLYLAITVMLATAPTKRDLRYLLLGLLVMVVANRVFGILGDAGEEILSAAWFEADPVTHKMWLLSTFLVSVLFGLFMIVVCIDVVRKVREVAMEPEPTLPADPGTTRKTTRSSART
jgi:hypothetical protein